MKYLFPIVCLIVSRAAFALPVDWNGVFGVDTTLIDNYRRLDGALDTSGGGGGGSQEVPLARGSQEDASFQTYIFRLNPTIIVNDFASLFGEFSSGYARGGRLGDDSTRALDDRNFGSNLYVQNASTGSDDLAVTKLYAKYYSDTATYILGRHDYHWALGAVYNAGEDTWDRHSSVRDGITIEAKLGNFHMTPYWAKISNRETLTSETKIREYGFGFLYDNPQRDIAFGVHYGKKASSPAEESLASVVGNAALGATDVKIMDLFLKKSFERFEVAVEVPVISGRIGNFYGTGDQTRYKARAFIVDGKYRLTDMWNLSLTAGRVGGDSGDRSTFEAMYLHPNFQIANLLFRHNLRAVADPTNVGVFDSYITNATFARLKARYEGEKWSFDVSGIWARADQVARAGSGAFNHTMGRPFTAGVDQDDSLGMEIDMDFLYRWNKEVSIGVSSGYLLTGDYYAFTNDPNNPRESGDSFMLQLRTAITF